MDAQVVFMILSYLFLFVFMTTMGFTMRSEYDTNLKWIKILALGTEKEKAEAIEEAERKRRSVHACFFVQTFLFFLTIACVWTWSYMRFQNTDEVVEVTILPIQGWNATPWPGGFSRVLSNSPYSSFE